MEIPRHIAFIMDGNGRWARSRGLPRIKGHEAGAEAVRRVVAAALRHGVRYLTLYAFSVENWSRPQAEVKALMRLLGRFVSSNADELRRKGVRVRVMGRRSDLPRTTDRALAAAELETAPCSKLQLVICVSYGGRTEIAEAARRLALDAAAGRIDPTSIDESAVASRLYLPDVPDPDLVVRTSGERRLSNFLLWQCAYAEMLFVPVLWPDFDMADFDAALEDYASRSRRFGGV